MASNLGSLTVSLGLDAAEYTRGLNKAEKDAYDLGYAIGDGIKKGAVIGAAALTTLGITAAATFNKLIEGAGVYADIADKTGATAEAVASFAVAANTSGVSLEKIGGAANTMAKNLVGVNDESKAAGAALKSLGINIAEFKNLRPEDQIDTLSKTLAGFSDGAGKSAAAMAIFGKSGAEILPFLKTLEEQGGRQKILTQEQIELMDAYGDRQAKVKAELELYAQVLASQALPYISAFTAALTDTAKELLGVDESSKSLKNSTAVADFAENAVRVLGFIVDAADGVVRAFQIIGSSIGAQAAAVGAVMSGDFKGAINIAKEGAADVKAILDRPLFSSKLDAQIAKVKAAAASPAAGGAKLPDVKYNGATKSRGGGDDPTKKLLDNELKESQRAIKAEQDLLRDRNRTLDLYYGENLVSIEDYYAGRTAAAEEATQKEGALIREQIAALEKYKSAASKDKDRAEAQGKINALLDAEEKLQRQAGQTALEESFKKAKALESYKDSIDQARASLMDLQGNSGGAVAVRTEIQYRELLSKAIANNDAEGRKLVETLKQQSVYQAQFQQSSAELGRANSYLQIEEERIQRNRQLGATSELQSLVQLRDARQAAIGPLAETVAQLAKIADASKNPALMLQAEQAKAALESLKATADPLAQKIEGIFSDSFGNAFADFITGSKSAKEAFASFANSVISQIARMASEALAKQIFGSLFGGSSGGSSGDFLSSIAGLFGGARAGGGPVSAGKLYQVNERGPELLDVGGRQLLMMGAQGGRVTPNNQLSGPGGAVIQQFTVGDVPTMSSVRQAVQVSQKQSAAALARSSRYGGAFA